MLLPANHITIVGIISHRTGLPVDRLAEPIRIMPWEVFELWIINN